MAGVSPNHEGEPEQDDGVQEKDSVCDSSQQRSKHQFLQSVEEEDSKSQEISAEDFFTLPGGERAIKTVLMKGIAGIGKTVAVQKFSLDWAEGKHNQHIEFIFVLPFRELNLIKDVQFSLLGLLTYFHPELKQVQDAPELVDKQILLIFDGLDESRFQLAFDGNERGSDLAQTSSVGVLLTNLIMGSLLPNALLWITSRTTAANQIPPEYVDRVSEVQGFTDPQKEEFFGKKFPDDKKGTVASIKKMSCFFFMGHIPIFCWITAEVFQRGGSQPKAEGITTVTELYIHYLLIQAQRAIEKYEEHKSHDMDPKSIVESRTFKMFLKLCKLAFEQLEEGNVIFYEEDLRKCGIDVSEASVFCGLCSEILKLEYGLYKRKMFSFIHLSFQEFLAALYVFHCCVNQEVSALESLVGEVSPELPQHELMKRVVKKALQSETGHLNLFLCFFLGISLESSQILLQGLLAQRESSSETVEEMRRYLREPGVGKITPERQMNLFLCQYEMKVHTVQKEIKTFIESGVYLSPINQSILSSMLLMSEEVLEEIDLGADADAEGLLSLVPAALQSPLCQLETFRMRGCHMTVTCCDVLATALSSKSHLRELDLSHNNLQDCGVDQLSVGLSNPLCRLEILRLSMCRVTERGCSSLASALSSNPSYLRELDLSYNHPGHRGVKLLSARLEDPKCKLEKLSVDHDEEYWGDTKLLKNDLPSEGLSVAHVTDEGVSLLEPQEINNTHVVVNVTHLSDFGLIKQRLLAVVKRLTGQQFKEFQWHLTEGVTKDFPTLTESKLENADMLTTVNIMVQRYKVERAVDITRQVLRKIPRNDLVEEL
ncbi:NACHT, LRR and PYD domains-containing protein 3-like [Aplochiton taeniatus]